MLQDLEVKKAKRGDGRTVVYSGFVNGFRYPYEIALHVDDQAAADALVAAFEAVRGVEVTAREDHDGTPIREQVRVVLAKARRAKRGQDFDRIQNNELADLIVDHLPHVSIEQAKRLVKEVS